MVMTGGLWEDEVSHDLMDIGISRRGVILGIVLQCLHQCTGDKTKAVIRGKILTARAGAPSPKGTLSPTIFTESLAYRHHF